MAARDWVCAGCEKGGVDYVMSARLDRGGLAPLFLCWHCDMYLPQLFATMKQVGTVALWKVGLQLGCRLCGGTASAASSLIHYGRPYDVVRSKESFRICGDCLPAFMVTLPLARFWR